MPPGSPIYQNVNFIIWHEPKKASSKVSKCVQHVPWKAETTFKQIQGSDV